MKFILKPFGMATILVVIGTLAALLISSNARRGANAGTGVTAGTRRNLPLPKLPNPSMTEGTDEPTDWSSWTDKGAVDFRRDTKVFKLGPASLSLVSPLKESYGSTMCNLLNVHKGATFRVRGYFKVAGQPTEVAIGVKMDNLAGQQVGWVNLAKPTGVNADWTLFEAPVQISDDASVVGVHVTIRGQGTVWVDELEILPAVP